MQRQPSFRVGTFRLNAEPNFNFQLNRTVMWSEGDVDELMQIGPKIKDTSSWERELISLGETALADGRTVQAIAYFRMAEFFMFDGNPRKLQVYRRARNLFYDYYEGIFESGTITRTEVPYRGGRLPVWIARPNGKVRDTIVLHGGNDSYMEEFLAIVLYLRANGFAVYCFEGPGQGAVLREQKMPFTHEWDQPVRTVLDAFGLDDATLIGISLGAVLAPRAAAFEKRIKRVVAWCIMPNFLDVLISTRKKGLQRLLRLLLSWRARPLINLAMARQMRRDPMAKWGIEHGMHNMGVHSAYDYFLKANQFRLSDIAQLIDQDFLLLGAQHDHFVPVAFYKREIDSLVNVRSLAYRLFTDRESAGNHCAVGNTKLALDTIVGWLELVKAPCNNGQDNGSDMGVAKVEQLVQAPVLAPHVSG